jgi:type IV fimbrial biogenesis protein FimT
MKTKRENGFTLYELMITVLIVGLVLSFGIPNFNEFTANSRMTSTANDLHSAFHMARSEAARAKTNITICASKNSTAADPDCDGTFNDGWIVFQDPDGDGAHDTGEAVLRIQPPVNEGVNIDTAGDAPYFSFASTGLGRGNITGDEPVSTALICDERGNAIAPGGRSAARAVIITPLGRAAVFNEQSVIQNIIDDSGASCP